MTPKLASIRMLGCLLAFGLVPPLSAAPPPKVDPPGRISEISQKAEVALFLARLTGNDDLEAKIGDFQKLDLNGDGRQELVATVDYSGREFFNNLVVVWQDSDGTRAQEIKVWDMESLRGVIVDLDDDGRQEILAQELLTPYLGVRPYAVWTSIKSLEEGEYVDSSSRFPAFYASKILPPLKEKLERLGPRADKHTVQVTEIALDKALRILGQDPEAGLQSALSWSTEPDPLSRIYAVAVLREIEDPSAATALERLMADSDREVAAFARSSRNAPRSREQP